MYFFGLKIGAVVIAGEAIVRLDEAMLVMTAPFIVETFCCFSLFFRLMTDTKF